MRKFLNRHSVLVLQLPFLCLFAAFIVLPVLAAVGLSFTDFDSVQTPNFVGLKNYIDLITKDTVFMQHSLPNTLLFALVVGIGGYILSFMMAWSLAQITKWLRTILAVMLYSPSLTGAAMMGAVWKVLFSEDKTGFLNALLLEWGVIQVPIAFLTKETTLMPIMMLVSLWSSMGIGFLAMLAGILNVNRELYEAAYIDGVTNRYQEIIYVTIPATRPQMLFGAVMAVVGTFQNGLIGVDLSGANPTPGYAGQLLVAHIEDFGFLRYEMGYAAAISVVLLLLIYAISRVARRLFADKEGL
ncbi:MAG: sugar ABC transporter permease [Oscillospiraceae bacterium]|jgi:multiple sugar transport system permease protein|nr:sugar ABC transporter permease [Oscillospiraceae bacterium]